MNDGLRVENLRSKGVKRLPSRRVKRAIFPSVCTGPENAIRIDDGFLTPIQSDTS